MCDSRVGISRDAMSASLALLVGSAGSGIPNTTGGRGTYARESPADKKEEQIQVVSFFDFCDFSKTCGGRAVWLALLRTLWAQLPAAGRSSNPFYRSNKVLLFATTKSTKFRGDDDERVLWRKQY